MREKFKCWKTIEVRWGDMDAFSHVNNAMYFVYFESGRVHYFEQVKLMHEGVKTRHSPAIVSTTINYRQQVAYPAELEVATRATKIGNSSLQLEQVIMRKESTEVVADGTAVIVWVDYELGKSIPLPDELRKAIRFYDGLEA